MHGLFTEEVFMWYHSLVIVLVLFVVYFWLRARLYRKAWLEGERRFYHHVHQVGTFCYPFVPGTSNEFVCLGLMPGNGAAQVMKTAHVASAVYAIADSDDMRRGA